MKRKILIISAILISSFSHADSWESITKSTNNINRLGDAINNLTRGAGRFADPSGGDSRYGKGDSELDSASTLAESELGLAEVMYNGLPADFSHLISSVLPDHFQACVNVIMITRISVFVFDLKQKFLDYANKVI